MNKFLGLATASLLLLASASGGHAARNTIHYASPKVMSAESAQVLWIRDTADWAHQNHAEIRVSRERARVLCGVWNREGLSKLFASVASASAVTADNPNYGVYAILASLPTLDKTGQRIDKNCLAAAKSNDDMVTLFD